MHAEDDFDDLSDLDDGPTDADLERFDDDAIVCRACGEEYSDLLDDCPRCGMSAYGGNKPMSSRRRATWVALLVVVVLVLLSAAGAW